MGIGLETLREKTKYLILSGLFFVGLTFGQNSVQNRTELETYSDTLSTHFILLENEFYIGLVNNLIVENPDLNPCIEIKTDKEKNLLFIDMLDKLGLLDKLYGLIGFEFIEIESRKIIETDDVKFFIQFDYQPPGHFESLYIPIFNESDLKTITKELSLIYDSKYCFKKMKRIAKKTLHNNGYK